MKWNKYTLTTTAEAEDMISSMMMEAGIEGIEIEDKVPLSESDKSQMFVDILPEGPADDGVAKISFYLEPDADNAAMLKAVEEGLEEIRSWGINIGAATIEASQTEDKDWINNWKQYFHQESRYSIYCSVISTIGISKILNLFTSISRKIVRSF